MGYTITDERLEDIIKNPNSYSCMGFVLVALAAELKAAREKVAEGETYVKEPHGFYY